MNHDQAAKRAQAIAEACCARQMNRSFVVNDLVAQGLSPTESDVGIEVVASAFGWAILRRMGVESFPHVYQLQQEGAEPIEVRIADLHLFTAALGIAIDLFENGYTSSLPKDGVSTIVEYSSEVSAVSTALRENPSTDLSQTTLRPASFFGFERKEFLLAAGYQGEAT